MYSANLATIATIFSLIMLELLPACFSCSNNFNLLHNSSGSDYKKFVFETLEAETIKLGDLSNYIRVLSRVDFLLIAFRSNFNSFAKLYFNFLSDNSARSTL